MSYFREKCFWIQVVDFYTFNHCLYMHLKIVLFWDNETLLLMTVKVYFMYLKWKINIDFIMETKFISSFPLIIIRKATYCNFWIKFYMKIVMGLKSELSVVRILTIKKVQNKLNYFAPFLLLSRVLRYF